MTQHFNEKRRRILQGARALALAGAMPVLVRADDKDADRAVEMLRASGASRVNKHD